MVDHLGAGIVHVDSTGVLFNASCVNVSRDGATSINLSHNLVITHGSTILSHSDLRVVVDLVAIVGAMVTVHAHIDGRALHVLGLVLLASKVGDSVLCDPSIGWNITKINT